MTEADSAPAKLAPQEEWLFELGYCDPAQPDKPTHVLAGIWESQGTLAWTMHPIAERRLDDMGGTKVRNDHA